MLLQDSSQRHLEDESDEEQERVTHQRPASVIPDVVISGADEDTATERSPLLSARQSHSQHKRDNSGSDDLESQAWSEHNWHPRKGLHLPSPLPSLRKVYHAVTQPKKVDPRVVFQAVVMKPVVTLPAVFLGVLLNLLDALSYGKDCCYPCKEGLHTDMRIGIILFPLGEEVFASMGPDGVSMFYVSCIVAQLVYSSGSIFRGGVGSEMVCRTHHTVMTCQSNP